MKTTRFYYLWMILLGSTLMGTSVYAQDDLLAELDKQETGRRDFVQATFKGTRLINGHTIETKKKGELDFIISHRFGKLNSGPGNFFGLDVANMRLGLDYGITNSLNIGIGRSSYQKTYDGFLKYRILHQSSGKGAIPLSVTAFVSVAVNAYKNYNPDIPLNLSDRFFYTYQLLIARKFSERLSLQLMPTVIHRNQVTGILVDNDVYALGGGGRFKVTKRMAVNFEYYYRFNDKNSGYQNMIALGLDIETGGHVFQLQFTNAQAMVEKNFIAETAGNFAMGDIHFGFNISRTFQLSHGSGKDKEPKW